MDQDQCALNADGTLKDELEIEWDHSPSHTATGLIPTAPVSPSPQAGGFRFTQPMNPTNAFQLMNKSHGKSAPKASSAGASTSTKQPGTNSSKRKDTTGQKAQTKKPTAFDRVLGANSVTVSSSGSVSVASSESEKTTSGGIADDEPEKKRRRKGESTTDTLTIFEPVDPEDPSEGYRCTGCVLDKAEHPKWDIQIIYKGNFSTLRTHISRKSQHTHYDRYREACVTKGIEMNERSVPAKEKERLEKLNARAEAKAAGLDPGVEMDGDSQRSILDFAQKVEKSQGWTKDGLLDHILRFVIETDQALAITDHPSFRELLIYQRQKTKESDIPHRTKITECVLDCADAIQKELAKELEDAPGRISLTFDGWTSKIMTAYLAVTGHWITREWQLRSEILSFSELEGSHSGENMGEELYVVLEKYNITHKTQNLTSDNVTVNDKCTRILGNKLRADGEQFIAKEQRSHCFSHAVAIAEGKFLTALSPTKKKKITNGEMVDVPIVAPPSDTGRGEIDPDVDDEDTEEEIEALVHEIENAAAESLVPDSAQARLVASLLLKVRGFIAKVRRSPQAKRFFKKCCKEALDEILELLPYCKTRWGSWHGVIRRLLILKKAIVKFTNNADDSDEVPNVDKNQPRYSSYKFSEDEWKLLALIQKVLNVAASIQEDFAAEYYPTIWRILPLYEEFIGKWQEYANNPEMAIFRPALEAAIESLKKYYNKTDNSPVHIVSMYLNPCVKDEYFKLFWTESGRRDAQKTMEKVFDKYAASQPAPAPTSTASSTSNLERRTSWLAKATESRRAREQSTILIPRAELRAYLEAELLVIDESLSSEEQGNMILAWWKANASRFPVLSRIALDYLAIQGSSVPCERAFSDAGLTDTKRRARLLPENFGAIQTVKGRYKKERRRQQELLHAQRAAQKRRWDDDSVEQVSKQST